MGSVQTADARSWAKVGERLRRADPEKFQRIYDNLCERADLIEIELALDRSRVDSDARKIARTERKPARR